MIDPKGLSILPRTFGGLLLHLMKPKQVVHSSTRIGLFIAVWRLAQGQQEWSVVNHMQIGHVPSRQVFMQPAWSSKLLIDGVDPFGYGSILDMVIRLLAGGGVSCQEGTPLIQCRRLAGNRKNPCVIAGCRCCTNHRVKGAQWVTEKLAP
ncbi:hypothetical protein FG05_35011 [Fusarium graminearum]|nr:hypothetical protein FG05_35011 [Fusarium graminearum]